ncbi:EamA family transporter [Thiocapsa imhoffii]|uniref:EamA family transporter n=1 Tax=Thiocapsa imhoffii TaxID=382777 RepID=A0A9X1B9S9_9GAMM|nr:DMT family transporter [Thiocapsa imhoffii]MBK1645633.1 EamA family transporter [Thiocapsa imhoffii]
MRLSQRHSWRDWVMLLALTLMWGTSFLMTKIAVNGLPPDLVVAGRLLIAALLLIPAAWLIATRPAASGRLWTFYLLIAVFGNVLPFSLITWGQTLIDSGLAGILMAIMPLATLGLAHFLVPDEHITRYRVGGFILGFLGILVLMGPDAITDWAAQDGQLLPMLAVLAGAICYAISSILARLRPASDALFSAASTISLASLMMVPVLAWSGDLRLETPPATAPLVAVAALGVFATALATIVYFHLVKSAGPAFVSQLNYLIPLWAVAVGMVFLGEEPKANHLYALGLILCGILVTQLERRHGPRQRTQREPDAR